MNKYKLIINIFACATINKYKKELRATNSLNDSILQMLDITDENKSKQKVIGIFKRSK